MMNTEAVKSTGLLSERYDAVLVEDAGGLKIPLADDYPTIDSIKDVKYFPEKIFSKSLDIQNIHNFALIL